MTRYWKPNIPRSLYQEIVALFNTNPRVKGLYDDNPNTFIKEAIRDKINTLYLTESHKEAKMEEPHLTN